MSAAAAVKGTSDNKHANANHNSMAERHDHPPLNDLKAVNPDEKTHSRAGVVTSAAKVEFKNKALIAAANRRATQRLSTQTQD